MNNFMKSLNTGYSIHKPVTFTLKSSFSGYVFLFPLSCCLFQSLNATCHDANLNYSWVGGCRGGTMQAGIVKGRWAANMVNLLVSGLWFVLLSQILSFRKLCFPGLWRVGEGQRR